MDSTNNNNSSSQSSQSSSNQQWPVFPGKRLPRNCVVFFSQVTLIFIICITSIVNLSLGNGEDRLWITLLSSSIGYLLPSPKLSNKE